jgi:N-methylhydantoinase A/acetophenone carboxylase
MSKVVIFPFSSTFCAYGSSTMDVLHVYERSRRLPLLTPITRVWFEDFAAFNDVVGALEQLARRDFTGEGFDPDQISYALELDMKFGGQLNVKRVASPLLRVGSTDDMQQIYAAFEREFSEAYSPLGLNPEAGVEIEAFILKATLPQPTRERPRLTAVPADPSEALTGYRSALFEADAGPVQTPVYEMSGLRPGHRFAGSALIDSDDTTVVIAPGWSCEVDDRGGIVLSNDQEADHV